MFSKLGVLVLAGVVPAIGCGGELVDAESEAKQAAMADVGVTESAVTNPANGHDYLFVTTLKTWDEAQAYCQLAGGYSLVTINDAAEEMFLQYQEHARGQGLLYGWWIGANDRGIEGSWTWVNGTSSYTNWYPGEPNDAYYREDCATDRFGNPSGGFYTEQWNDDSCSVPHPFICERDTAPTSNRGSFPYAASNTNSADIYTGNTHNYALHLYAGQVFTVGTCGVPGATGSGDTYLRIRNPSGSEIASNDDASGPCGLLSNISIVVPVTGTYTIVAGCYSSGSCSGTVAFNY
ncbi:lectin-like protein [Archangium sp.]|uniref:lectin-like protein n=1 Tax=Archangium sp. TaxID=1872627 RepID=UPI002D6FCDF6|nr:lectin-like protein [Archangium sp.]HYO58560.1 lectin-like protein [Archangium sp.]